MNEKYKYKRCDDFKDWNMYKCFLNDMGLLNPNLEFKWTNWEAWLKKNS